jgi:tyrosyl-tRNA synthetase
MTNSKDQSVLEANVDIIPEQDWQNLLASKKSLRVKFGIDPTAPNLHFGHLLLFNKLRQFQEQGHQVIIVVGDFTCRIGDPSGKNVTRPILSQEDVAENVKTYQKQIFKVLDPKRTEVRYNSEWLDKLTILELIQIASKQTVARMLERDDFSQRFKAEQSIAIHEFMYPLLQGYDSVALQADIECGGTDQRFNLLMGRDMQKNYGQKPQVILTCPLLEGLDGVRKMSKSYGNTIGIEEPAQEQFGKIMSISDDLMWKYFTLLEDYAESKVQALQQQVSAGVNPRDIKLSLAQSLVARFHGAEEAKAAEADFLQRFSKQELPKDIQEQKVFAKEASMPLAHVLKAAALVSSASEGLRMIKQAAVRIDGEKVKENIELPVGERVVIQVGKRRFAKVILEKEENHVD